MINKFKKKKFVKRLQKKNNLSILKYPKKYFIKCIICIILLILLYLFIIFKIPKSIIINRPKISVILPIYNKEKYLHKSIGSILNQTFKDFEIVAVNDCSNDNTLNILNEFTKKDKRIKILNNHKNHGVTYTRIKGITNSIGEYLMFLEPDDYLEGKDNLQYLYNEYKNTKEDIIIYPHFSLRKKRISLRCEVYNKLIKQPELFNLMFRNDKIRDELIWNKLVKRELFLNISKIMGKYLNGKKWNHHEDIVWSLLIHKYGHL